MTDNLEIRADISPALHPEALAGYAHALAEKPGTYATGRDTLAAVYRWMGDVNDAENALQAHAAASAPSKRRQHPTGQSEFLGDLRLTGDGRLRQFSGEEEALAEAAFVAMERVTRRIDAARGELTATAENLDKQITFALTDPSAETLGGSGLAAEVRAHVKGLKATERFGFAMNAVKAGDLPTVAALLAGQPFLSGLKPEEWGQLRVEAAQAFAPKAVKEREAVGKLLAAVEQAGGEVIDRYAKVKRGADNPRAKANRELAKLKGAK